jgi:hypothetical protein
VAINSSYSVALVGYLIHTIGLYYNCYIPHLFCHVQLNQMECGVNLLSIQSTQPRSSALGLRKRDLEPAGNDTVAAYLALELVSALAGDTFKVAAGNVSNCNAPKVCRVLYSRGSLGNNLPLGIQRAVVVRAHRVERHGALAPEDRAGEDLLAGWVLVVEIRNG